MGYNDLELGQYEYAGVRFYEVGGHQGSEQASGSATATRIVRAFGTESPLVARTALLDGSLASAFPWNIFVYYNLGLTDLSWQWTKDSWTFTAKYDARQPKVGGYTIAIDTGGGTFKQTNAFDTTSYAAPNQEAPDFANSIDVQDGKVNGVDRIIPAMRINVRARIAKQYLGTPIAYAKLCASKTGFVNQSSFLNCSAKELLFAGASGDIVGDDPTLTFNFLYSPNLSNLQVGDITGINKAGHDYLWFVFKSDKDAANNLSVQIPRAAYVSRIYDGADFSDLAIGQAAT